MNQNILDIPIYKKAFAFNLCLSIWGIRVSERWTTQIRLSVLPNTIQYIYLIYMYFIAADSWRKTTSFKKFCSFCAETWLLNLVENQYKRKELKAI